MHRRGFFVAPAVKVFVGDGIDPRMALNLDLDLDLAALADLGVDLGREQAALCDSGGAFMRGLLRSVGQAERALRLVAAGGGWRLAADAGEIESL